MKVDDIINKLRLKPELLSASDLIEVGLFPSMRSIYNCRYRGTGPEFVRNGKKYLYPRDKVIKFLTMHTNELSRKKRLRKITGASTSTVEKHTRNLEWKYARYGESDGRFTINDYDNEY